MKGRGVSTVAIGTGDAPTIYVDNRNASSQLGDSQGVWFYMESNGIKNLQRGGGKSIALGEDDNCSDNAGPSDTLIL